MKFADEKFRLNDALNIVMGPHHFVEKLLKLEENWSAASVTLTVIEEMLQELDRGQKARWTRDLLV